MQTDTLYREEILEHYKNPLNFGLLENSTAKSKQLNPFCGDEIEMFVKIGSVREDLTLPSPLKGEGSIEDISFVGKGCAICMASASLLTEFAKEKTLIELTNFTDDSMLDLLGIDVSETRKKCALLPLAVLKDCIDSV